MIPRNIIVTDRERPETWLAQLARDNPSHKICFFDDKASRDLIVKYFPGDTLQAYDKLKPSAYRADLFRYCALQVMGGIYTDSLIPFNLPFDEFWDLNEDRVYLVRDKNERAIQVGAMACNRDSRFMQLCQQRATRNICANYYGNSPLSITGPEMAWRCFREYTGQPLTTPGRTYSAMRTGEPPVDISYQIKKASAAYKTDVAEAVFADARGEFLFPYKLNRDRQHRSRKNYYGNAWYQRTVYGEKRTVYGEKWVVVCNIIQKLRKAVVGR